MQTIANVVSSFGLGHWSAIILIVSIFIDITPAVKFNPIRWLLGVLGKWFNNSIAKQISSFKQEVDDKFVEIDSKFDSFQQELASQKEMLNQLVIEKDNEEISAICWEIMTFENSLQNGDTHPREQYRHILDRADKYSRMYDEDQAKDKRFSTEQYLKVKESVENIRVHYEKFRCDPKVNMF